MLLLVSCDDDITYLYMSLEVLIFVVLHTCLCFHFPFPIFPANLEVSYKFFVIQTISKMHLTQQNTLKYNIKYSIHLIVQATISISHDLHLLISLSIQTSLRQPALKQPTVTVYYNIKTSQTTLELSNLLFLSPTT